MRHIFSLLVASASAELFLPSIFSDYMVLQGHASYDQRPFIYGDALPGDVVTVERKQPSGHVDTYYATADATGAWISQLDPDYFAASQNDLTITVVASSNTSDVRVFQHVVYGDVFLCSGQSNMNENVYASFDANETMAGSYPNLRLFSVAEGGSETPQRDLPLPATSGPNRTICTFGQYPVPNSQQVCNSWQVADSPTVIGAFSAACFYAALSLSQQLTGGRVLGLVHSSVSGTAMHQWAPPEALAACDAEPPRAEGARDAVDFPMPPGITYFAGNSSLFNAMINPISRFAIRGVWWDQGESDMGLPPASFSCLFQAIIESWRRRWRIGDFAWVFAQLGAQDSNAWPNYFVNTARGAQAGSLPGAPASTTNTLGMSAAYDIGDMGSPYPPYHVHSRRKKELGRRLALAMEHVQYALQFPASAGAINLSASVNWSPPTLARVEAAGGGALRLVFATLDGAGVNLTATADAWESCASSRDTVQVSADGAAWVNASIALDGATAVLATPVAPGTYAFLRYAPNLWPQCAVYAVGNGLPVIPFTAPVASAVRVAEAPVVSVKSARVVTPRVAGAWAGGWRGVPLPEARTGAAAVPPMGFNSWNAYHCNVDERILQGVADAFVSTGLAAAGYEYVNVDDCWQVDRQPNGTIIPDPVRFPHGMDGLSSYMAARGLLFGLYTAQREYTCQSRPGSWRFEAIDIDTYCRWGVSYVKTDACFGRGWNANNVTWIDFRAGIARCEAGSNRTIVLSVESCGSPSCGVWIKNLANLWRTTGDIQATWGSVMSNLDNNNNMAEFAGPGHFNDPDMLQVGDAGLSPDEARSHFAAWCVVAAPLLISNDLVSGVDAATIEILTAPEVIAVDQDALGVQGTRVSPAAPTGPECWARPLADGSVAALLLNRGSAVGDVSCSFAELGLPTPNGAAAVRDLWARADLGSFTGSFTARGLRPHASMLVKVKQV